MRPYLAIIQDSFREAIASRTLQVLLVLITLLLLALAVPGLRIEQSGELRVSEVTDPDGLAALFGRTRTGGLTPPQLQLRDRMPEELRQQFTQYRRASSPALRDKVVAGFVEEFNTDWSQGTLYDAEVWRDVSLTPEGRKLLGLSQEKRTAVEQRRLNRLLLDGAMEGYVQPAEPVRAYLTYVFGEMELPIPPEMVHSLAQEIVYQLLKWLVGAAGMLAAVIFTASIIPQMFEPGAIDLLLSKPVSRSGAFLARFCGGCAFILLNAGLFVVGLWLILGLRHGQWNARILWSIPVFLLAFSIYFSISAYVGVRWRNPILAIALALMAWIATFSLHQVWYWGQKVGLDGLRAESVIPAGTDPIVARKDGKVYQWKNRQWREIFTESDDDPTLAIQRGTGLLYPLLGPVLSGAGENTRLTAIERDVMPALYFSLGDIVTGTEGGGWRRQAGPRAPGDTIAILTTRENEVLLATRAGLQRVVVADESGEITLDPLGPDKTFWQEPIDMAIDPVTNDVVVCTRGRLVMLSRGEEGRYSVTRELATDDAAHALVALGPQTVVVARGNGTVDRYQKESLTLLPDSPKLPAAPRKVLTSPEGTGFAILDHERRLHRLDAEGQLTLADVRGQRHITAAAFAADGGLLVADRFPRITAYTPEGRVSGVWEHHTGFARLFLWVIHPLRTVLPKPDELDLLVGKVVRARGEDDPSIGGDLTRERDYVDLWTPVWTSALFVVVVLGVTCWSIERRDF